MDDGLRTFGQVLISVMLIALVLGSLLLALIYRSLRRIDVPPNADFFTTVRAVPLSLVVALDLLDLGLDVLATPIVWVILSRFRLQALRNVAAVEALIPFTQPIPTLTVAWFAARALNLGQPPRFADRRVIETEEISPGEYVSRSGRR
ncbi:MAG TPA: hypothetical protein VFZ66_00805 [Herpetosiphonaceae bacterium]